MNVSFSTRGWQDIPWEDQIRMAQTMRFGGVELYPTKEEKGARLGYSLISNHAFVDGNKRIGMYIMLTFLEVNGIRLDCTNEDIVEAGLGVASGKMSYEELLAWVKSHRT